MPIVDTDLTIPVQPPLNPIDSVSKAITLRSLMTENALRNQQILQSQQQTQNLQAEAQIRQRSLADQKTLRDALLGESQAGTPYEQVWPNALHKIQGKVDPQYLNTVTEGYNKATTEGLNMSAAQRKEQKDTLGMVDDALTGLRMLDPSQRPTEYQNMIARMQNDPRIGPKMQGLIANGTVPQHYDEQALNSLHATVVGQAGLLAEDEKRALAQQEQARAGQAQAETTKLGAELPGVQAESAGKVAQLPVTQAIAASTLASPGLLNPQQQQQQKNFEREQATRAGQLAVEQGRLGLEKLKTQAEYGPDTAQSWVDVLKRNPDAETEVPSPIRGKVANMFQQQTGLPMPKAAAATSQATELAARNALDNASFIEKAIQNPEIQKRLGPILGRLGTFEQNLGTATAGLSPQAAELAQELRTRMRYFVFQEGKAVLGGRLPQNLMNQLESSSADVHMDEPTLKGALQGAVGSAYANLDNVDKERFGGSARPRPLRGLPPESGTTRMRAPNGQIKDVPSDQVQHYRDLGAELVQP